MVAGVAHHVQPGAAARLVLPELGIGPGRIVAQVEIVVERLAPASGAGRASSRDEPR